MPKKEETKIQDRVRLELSKKGCKVFRCNAGNFYTKYGQEIKIGTPGHSDLYGFRPDGQIFYIETKLHPRKPTKEQRQFILTMIAKGAAAGVAYSVDEALKIVEWTPEFKAAMEGAMRYAK